MVCGNDFNPVDEQHEVCFECCDGVNVGIDNFKRELTDELFISSALPSLDISFVAVM